MFFALIIITQCAIGVVYVDNKDMCEAARNDALKGEGVRAYCELRAVAPGVNATTSAVASH